MLALCTLQHLVLARIGVACKMSDIGYVHGTLYVVAGKAQIFFKHVLHHIRTEIAYMRIMINGRTAGIHFHLAAFVRNEFFNRFGQCIVKLHIASIRYI